MVFQSYALFPNMTVGDNVGFGLRVAKRPAAEIAARIREMLELIKLPALAGRYPFQLSGGQQQRVALARALAIKPKVLLLDEPLSALDAKIRVALRNEIRTIQRELGITTIYVTHDQEEALSLSDRVVVMRDGRVEQVGTPFEIYNFPRTGFVASFVGTLSVLRGEVTDPGRGAIVVDGQEIRAARGLEGAGVGEIRAVALRPEIVSLNEPGAKGNRMQGTVEDVNFLGSIVRIRVKVGEGEDGATPTVIALDAFNEPHLRLPDVDTAVPISFPPEACFVLGAARDGALANAEAGAEV